MKYSDPRSPVDVPEGMDTESSECLLREIENYRKAFEEDSIDEYIEENPPLRPQIVEKFKKMKRDMDRVHYEIVKRKRKMILSIKNNTVPNIPLSINNIDKYNNLRSGKSNYEKILDDKIMPKMERITVKSNENQSARFFKSNSPEVCPYFAKKDINYFRDIKKVRNKKSLEENIYNCNEANKTFTKFEAFLSNYKNYSSNDFVKKPSKEMKFEDVNERKILDNFMNNPDFSPIVPESERLEYKTALDFLKMFICINKNNGNYKNFYLAVKRALNKMLKFFDNNIGTIERLIKEKSLLEKNSSKINISLIKDYFKDDKKSGKIYRIEKQNKVNFKCSFDNCGRVYSTEDSLNIHIQKHYLNKKNRCQFCSKQFKDYESCKKHMEKSHPQNESTKLSLT